MNSDLPSSVRKPLSNKRLSMAGATRASLLGSSIRSGGSMFDSISGFNNNANYNNNPTNTSYSSKISNIPGSAKRRSTLLSTPASNNSSKRRQSSILPSSQQSSQSYSNGQSSSQQQQQQYQSQQQSQQPQQQQITHASYIKIDQRPLKDKNYQTLIQQEIYDFLSANKFELDMNHPLTSRTLKQPTQKDFVLIFQFLYNKIDPNYKFTKSIQTEVTNVLKMLNYPYLDGINRSQITAVGGTNWPSILGMLYWLVKINLSLLNFNDEDLISPDDKFDKYFINYTMKSYRSFIDQNEDYSEFYDEMKLNFDQGNNELLSEIDELNIINKELQDNFDKLNNQFKEYQDGELKSKALESDLVKFQAYLETMESRKSKWSEILKKINSEISNCEDELKKIDNEKQDIEKNLLDKGFTIIDIDNLNNERDKVLKSIDLLNNKLDDLKYKLQTKDIDLNKNYQSLDNFIKQYNNIIYKIPSSGYNFEIKLNEDLISNSEFEIFKPHNIINKILKDEKIELLKFRSELNTKIHQNQDDSIKLQEQSDLIGETIMEQQEEIDSLEAKFSINKSTYDEIYETMINNTTTYSMQIEKLERELRSIKINTNQGFIEIENKYQNLSIEVDELNHEILLKRSLLHDKIQKIIEYVITFKINIQQNLEDLDNLVNNEFENETKISS